jgi:hypothetical protein
MRAIRVVVLKILDQSRLEVTTTEDQHPVETLTAQGANHRFADGMHAVPGSGVFTMRMGLPGRRPRRTLGNLASRSPDQELGGARPLRQFGGEVPRLLGSPTAVAGLAVTPAR